MNKKLIIFDKDGTLLDFDAYWIPVSQAALSDLVKSANLDDSVIDEIFDAFLVKTGVTAITSSLCHGTYDDMGHDIWGVLNKHNAKLSENEVKALTRELYHKYIENGEIKPTSEKLGATLDALKNDGYILGVVTSDAPLVTEECLKALKIRDFFSFVITDDGVTPTKPSPVSLASLMKKYSLSQDEILMVGDTLTDLNYAKAGGVDFLGLAKSRENASILSRNGAEYIIDDISKIFNLLD